MREATEFESEGPGESNSEDRASFAACNSKLVVPKAFVEPDLAEHTIASR